MIFKQKGVGCKDVSRETKRAKLFWAKLFIRNRAKAPRPSSRGPRPTQMRTILIWASKSAPRDPLIPVIIITGISDSFKIKHLAVSEAREPRQSLHLVFAMVRGGSPSGHGPPPGGRFFGPKSTGGRPARAPFPSLRTGRSRHVLSEAVVGEGSRLAALLRALSYHTMQVARFTNSWRISPLVTQKKPGVWAPG